MRNDLIRKLERWEKNAKVYNQKANVISKQKDAIIEQIENDPIRITEVTKEILSLREKALKNKKVKSIMEKYGIQIEEIALVANYRETIDRPGGPMYQDGWSNVYMRSENLKDPELNRWALLKSYRYGGPGDAFQVLFKWSNNSRWYVSGIIFNFPKARAA